MRCLTLADELQKHGAEITFLMRSPPDYLAEMIRAKNHNLAILPETDQAANSLINVPETTWSKEMQDKDSLATLSLVKATDWLIVDHYGLDAHWEKSLRTVAPHLLVIDDLANRTHDCDLLLDQNLGRKCEDYQDLVSDKCTVLVGPDYALLRPDFAATRSFSLKHRSALDLRQILISMGGIDKDNATGKILGMLAHYPLPPSCTLVVILGAQSPWKEQVITQASQMPWPTQVRSNVTDMATLMAESDIAIGAAGGTAWERCCLGLPTLVVTLAENQRSGAKALEAAGCIVQLDISCDQEMFNSKLNALVDYETRKSMELASSRITDGTGTLRITSHMCDIYEC